MLKIRLQRVGRKHDPSFRIVLTDSKNGPRSGNFLEILGNYDPKKDVRKINADRVKELISQGAKISDTVHNLLINENIIKGKKINVLPKKSPIIKEKTEEEKAKEKAEATPKVEKTVEVETPVEETPKEGEEKPEVVEEAPTEDEGKATE